MLNAASLPNDIDSLKQLVLQQQALLASRDVLIERLRLELARLKRARFGRSSEQLDAQIAQLEFTLEELEASAAPAMLPAMPITQEPSSTPSKPVRKPLPDHLPREIIVHQGSCSCAECGSELAVLGEDVSEVLEYVPACFKVIRHVRPKFSCPKCQSITQAPAP